MQNLRGLWAEAAKKRADDHAIQMKAMGHESSLTGDEMPGDISIQGDNYYYGAQPAAQTTTPAAVDSKPSAKRSWFWPVLVAGSTFLGGGGIGLAVASYLQHQPATPAASVDTDTITEFDFPNQVK